MNPVMSRLQTDVEKTPAGYPGMPGYQPNASAHPGGAQQAGYPGAQPGFQSGTTREYSNPYGIETAPGRQDMGTFEQTYHARSADAFDTNRVTMDDIITKTGLLFTITVVLAAVSWFISGTDPRLGGLLMTVGAIGGFITAMINIFKKVISPVLVVAYAGLEGLFLGGTSAFFELMYPGIVVQAVIATVIVFAVTLTLFKMRVVRMSAAMNRFTIIGLISVFLFFLASFGYSWMTGTSLGSITLFGIPLGLIVGIICIVLAVTSLIADFAVAEHAVEAGMPKSVAWRCAFGLMVTLIWLYINILRVLAYIAEMSR